MLHKTNIWPKYNKEKTYFNLCICVHHIWIYVFMKFYTCILQQYVYMYFFSDFFEVWKKYFLWKNKELYGARPLLALFDIFAPMYFSCVSLCQPSPKLPRDKQKYKQRQKRKNSPAQLEHKTYRQKQKKRPQNKGREEGEHDKNINNVILDEQL